ncbi:phosphatidylserine decarboxylase-domain-containing protein [Earliella scabrosa]|nr:phosphatidylserine decarboxylase-domain-containing protein [Earliella scabrosa]
MAEPAHCLKHTFIEPLTARFFLAAILIQWLLWSMVYDAATPANAFGMQTTRKTSSNIVQELRDYLDAHPEFKKDFEESFQTAHGSGIREFDDYNIVTFDNYIDWYEYLLGWVPSEQRDGKFVYHVLCLFYFVMNIDPLQTNWTSPILPTTHAPYTWLSDWVVRYAKEIGKFMDTPGSITPYTLDTFYNSPSYHMEDYPKVEWKTFNEFFARHIDLKRRPIDSPNDNKVIVSPADAVFDGAWDIDDQAQCSFKDIPWPISELLDDMNSGGSSYGPLFAGGKFCHSFLGPNDYHRQHAPVSGTVVEARVIEGLCYLQVVLATDRTGRLTIAPRRKLIAPPLRLPGPSNRGVPQLDAPDEPGYQFIQARALVLIKTDETESDIGYVAVLPIGMAQVSSVVLSVKAGDKVKKGNEISYFQFGGSDICMVFQKQANVNFTADVDTHYNVREKIAEAQI